MGIVWILGAGFSRPLGGPLLNDLFTLESLTFVTESFPFLKKEYEHLAIAHKLFDLGIGSPNTTDTRLVRRRVHLWRNAEEFIEKLDLAFSKGEESPQWKTICKIGGERNIFNNEKFEPVYKAARRFLAAECSAFLKDADTSEERWQPYIYWNEKVYIGDTIITFNYDRVLEIIASEHSSRYRIFLPGEKIEAGVAPVLKLHGSVDWKRDESGEEVKFSVEEPEFALKCPYEKMAIATPGPSKISRTQELEPLWRVAEERIQSAQAIVFIGYRFPPTDSLAKKRLLDAISKNESQYLAVHTVLGIHSSEDSRRLNQLLHWTLRKTRVEKRDTEAPSEKEKTYNVLQHSLFAEDFLPLFTRKMIELPFEWGLFRRADVNQS